MSGDVDSPTDADKAPTFGATPADAGPAAETPPFERTEVQVGAAFAGGLLFAMILKRFGS